MGDAPADVPWTFVEMNPYVDGGFVVSTGSMSHALLDDAGRQVVKLPGNLLNPWATDGTGDETLLVTAGASELLAVDRSGRELWRRDLVSGVSFALVRADGVAVIADALGGLSAVELETGQERWAIEAGELVPNIDPWLGARFAATDGRLALLAVGTLEDAGMRLVTLDLRSGRVVWEAQRGGDEPVELVAAGGVLLERVSSGRSTSEVALDGTTVLIDGSTLSRLAGK
jgi:outer membrane protein assembly factor BamB